MFSNLQGIIHFPKRYSCYFYSQVLKLVTMEKTKMDCLGIMITNSITGERTTVKNRVYDTIRSSLINFPINHYQYLCLFRINKVDDFLLKYPSYTLAFSRFERHYKRFITNVHNSYYSYYVNKTGRAGDISDKYLYHIHKLHSEVYLPSLASSGLNKTTNRKVINKEAIREYFKQYEPHQLLYYLNYERRNHSLSFQNALLS